jgi:hypothetical protein
MLHTRLPADCPWDAHRKLLRAAGSGNVARVRELAALGTDVTEKDADGWRWTALHVAAQN